MYPNACVLKHTLPHKQTQGVPLSDLRFKRVLFGGFPCWNNGPLKPRWDHIMQVG